MAIVNTTAYYCDRCNVKMDKPVLNPSHPAVVSIGGQPFHLSILISPVFSVSHSNYSTPMLCLSCLDMVLEDVFKEIA